MPCRLRFVATQRFPSLLPPSTSCPISLQPIPSLSLAIRSVHIDDARGRLSQRCSNIDAEASGWRIDKAKARAGPPGAMIATAGLALGRRYL